MSRPDRWWRPSTTRRPPLRARARRYHADKELNDTFDTGYDTGYAAGCEEIDDVIRTSMDVGAMEGRKKGERDTYLKLYQLLRDHDYDELAAQISGRALGEFADTFLLIESARQNSPDEFRQLAEAVELGGEEGKEALEALAREWGIFPEGDNLLDLADAAGVTPLDEADAEQVGDSIERWLANREDFLRMLREQDGEE